MYGELVARSGLSASHRLLLESVADGSTVLDVGCSEGYLAAALARRGCRLYGIETDPAAAAAAREHCIEVWNIDVEDVTAREVVPETVDTILFGDVLEHMRDPWAVLAWAAARLPAGGLAAVSVPNAVHWAARREIMRGRFPLDDWGTFDRTHLRWFTRASAHQLIRGAGLLLERERFTPAPLPGEARLRRVLGRGDVEMPDLRLEGLRQQLADRRPELFALQFVLSGRVPQRADSAEGA